MSSFCETLKAELCGLPVKAGCCRKALLYGLLIHAERDRSGCVHVTYPAVKTPNGETDIASLAVSLIKKQLGRDAEMTPVTKGAHRYVTVTFTSSQAVDVLNRLSTVGTEGQESGDIVAEEVIGFKCPNCTAHFLRGVFLATGSVNDPNKSIHMEMRLPADGRTDCVEALWCVNGITPGVTQRQDGCGVYFKRAEALQEAVGCLGGVHSLFDFVNISMMRELRADEIRATNWEAVNIGRAVTAGQRYISAIHDLQEWNVLYTLPPELRETAELRILHDDMPLSELASLHNPPVTKSGLNHRLQKILKAWEAEKRKHEI